MIDSETDSPSIRALIVFRGNEETDNLFVPILCDTIRMAGIDVGYFKKDSWESDTTYDVIHFQWPKEVVGWVYKDHDVVRHLKECITFFRSRGTYFVHTQRSIRPHYTNEVISRVYDIIESENGIAVYMGRYSLTGFIERHPSSRNVIVPHHVYQYTYKEDISIERVRQYLNFPQEAFVVTIFGKFHNREGRRIMLEAFHDWNEEQKLLIVPRLYPFSRHNSCGRGTLKRWASRIGCYILMPLFNHIFRLQVRANDELIDEYNLPYYMAASDVVFIQRKGVLSSANILLAFLFHKIAIGPSIGSTGELLNSTGNPIFSPDNRAEIMRALEEARQSSAWGKGEMNYAYALENMGITKVGKQCAKLYNNLANQQ